MNENNIFYSGSAKAVMNDSGIPRLWRRTLQVSEWRLWRSRGGVFCFYSLVLGEKTSYLECLLSKS
jgi:hypothetical protein